MAAEHEPQHEPGHSAEQHAPDTHHAAHDPFAKDHLIGHVKDAEYFEFPRSMGGKIEIPQLFKTEEPLVTFHVGFKAIDDRIEPFDLKLTKFMVLEAIVAVVLIVLFSCGWRRGSSEASCPGAG